MKKWCCPPAPAVPPAIWPRARPVPWCRSWVVLKKSCQQAMFHMGIDQQVTWDLTEPNWKATNQGSKLPCGTSRVKKNGIEPSKLTLKNWDYDNKNKRIRTKEDDFTNMFEHILTNLIFSNQQKHLDLPSAYLTVSHGKSPFFNR